MRSKKKKFLYVFTYKMCPLSCLLMRHPLISTALNKWIQRLRQYMTNIPFNFKYNSKDILVSGLTSGSNSLSKGSSRVALASDLARNRFAW